jgi:hypothetical protein
VIVAALCATAPALAEDRQAAARAFDAGEAAFRKANYASAAQSFEAAYKALPAPEIAFSAAQAYRLANSLLPKPRPEYVRRAIELYETYVAAVKEGGRVGDAAVHLQALRAIWRDLEGEGAARMASQMTYDRTQLTVWTDVEGAAITIDDNPASAYAYVDVAPGEHVVKVAAEGYFAFEQRVSVAKGAQVPVTAALRAKPATLRVVTEDGAEIAIDGRAVALVDGKVETNAGKRYLTVTRAGREPFAKALTLAPGSENEVTAALSTTPRRKAARWVMWGAVGLGAVTAATTTVAFIADSKAVEQRDVPNQASDDTYERWRQRRDTFRTAAIISGGLTLAAAATAAVLAFSDHPRAEPPPLGEEAPEKKGPMFTPMVWADGVGVSLEGGF